MLHQLDAAWLSRPWDEVRPPLHPFAPAETRQRTLAAGAWDTASVADVDWAGWAGERDRSEGEDGRGGGCRAAASTSG